MLSCCSLFQGHAMAILQLQERLPRKYLLSTGKREGIYLGASLDKDGSLEAAGGAFRCLCRG